ncbi:hypothetical protein ABKA04_006245 [Annulohypoxylon sp. FPYF3050]
MPREAKPYFLFSQPKPIGNDELNGYLGMAVTDFDDPFGADAERRPTGGLRPRDAIDNLYPQSETRCKDVNIVEKGAVDRNAQIRFQQALKFWYSSERNHTSALTTPYFRRIGMESGREKINDLLGRASFDDIDEFGHIAEVLLVLALSLVIGQVLYPLNLPFQKVLLLLQLLVVLWLFPKVYQRHYRHEQLKNRAEYRKQVLELLKRQRNTTHGRLGIVNSMIICTDLGVNTSTLNRDGAGAHAGTGTTGAGLEVDVSLNQQDIHTVGISGAYKGDYIIAFSYLPLYLKRDEGTRSRLSSWIRRRPIFQVGSDEEILYEILGREITGNMGHILGATDSSEATGGERFWVNFVTMERSG